jgi:hypothetical protein
MTVDRQPFLSRLMLAVLLVGGMTSTAAAQGGVRGLVRDGGGTGIAGARVIAESLETSQTRTATTNGSGRFAFIGLAGGDWVFLIQADGFREEQGYSVVRRSGRPARVEFTLDLDPFNPTPPSVGVLAGLKSADLLSRLRGAERLLDGGNYDGAIGAYRDILNLAPALTSVNLSIGHAYRAKREPEQALAAYRGALSADPTNPEVLAAISALDRGQ